MDTASRNDGQRQRGEDEIIRISDSQGRWIGLPAVAPREWRIRFDEGALELRLHKGRRMTLGSVPLLGVALAFILAVLFGFWLFDGGLPGLFKDGEETAYQVYKDFYGANFIAVVLRQPVDADRMWDEAAKENGFRDVDQFREWANEKLEADVHARAAKRAQDWYMQLIKRYTDLKTAEARQMEMVQSG